LVAEPVLHQNKATVLSPACVMLVGGTVAVGSKTMSAEDARSIEARTGVLPDELEDADSAEAMQQLWVAGEGLERQAEGCELRTEIVLAIFFRAHRSSKSGRWLR
jgi:hypothetical protein